MTTLNNAINLTHYTFEFDFNAVLDRLWIDNNFNPVNLNGYFLSTHERVKANDLKLVNPKGIIYLKPVVRLLDHPPLTDAGLILGHCALGECSTQQNIEPQNTNDFLMRLLRYQVKSVQQYLEQSHRYLKARSVDNITLDKNPVLEQAQAEVISHLFNASSMLDDSEWLNYAGFISDSLDKACLKLIKIIGGRSMIRGNAVQMRMVFKVLNKTFF
ncbi:hypothetical protein [Marinicella sp. W31]|uniref:hypothetical protein n=1 Tax=Marinicella sp. W31 TaxID=3023713 RepID=UPI003757CF13